MTTIDLNCDMGESFGAYQMGDDMAMMNVITTANIACGFHAGDPSVMRDTILAAKAKGVAIGAHPSLMDLYGFGRRRISGERPEDLEAQLIYQIAAIQGMATALGWPITHMKTHGALNNMAAEDATLAKICVSAIRTVDPSLVFITLPFSETMKAAEAAGLTIACEVYADRRYTDNGMLAPRQMEGAVIHDLQQSVDQVLSMLRDKRIPTIGGGYVPVEPATVCIHGDTPGAVATARAMRQELTRVGIDIVPFAKPVAGAGTALRPVWTEGA
ncbi:LamB/YcsF family protein [Neorhizobium lilium]|uniref:5-oxoprolinase subunit A n=1 Tax=Neorhizobium lilium TaxID=2503024 RepID=A0A444LN65_9HYPH|nr:5-oxoprolinase subunit PxpA [Neorhizobium lilium]RWX81775.1 LamB/YcsF family protein [Neorhizobium lilium]